MIHFGFLEESKNSAVESDVVIEPGGKIRVELPGLDRKIPKVRSFPGQRLRQTAGVFPVGKVIEDLTYSRHRFFLIEAFGCFEAGEIAQEAVQEQTRFCPVFISLFFDEAKLLKAGDGVIGLVARATISRINAGGGDEQVAVDGDGSKP